MRLTSRLEPEMVRALRKKIAVQNISMLLAEDRTRLVREQCRKKCSKLRAKIERLERHNAKLRKELKYLNA